MQSVSQISVVLPCTGHRDPEVSGFKPVGADLPSAPFGCGSVLVQKLNIWLVWFSELLLHVSELICCLSKALFTAFLRQAKESKPSLRVFLRQAQEPKLLLMCSEPLFMG